MSTRKLHTKSSHDGKYHIGGKTFKRRIGLRRAVFEGVAYSTSGGLLKDDLLKNKWGRIVSKKKHKFESEAGRLRKYGYTACKGHFGGVPIKKDESKTQACARFYKQKKTSAKSSKSKLIAGVFRPTTNAPNPAPRYNTRSQARARA